MQGRSPLYFKGLIIIGVPLLFEIVIFSSLLFLQANYIQTIKLVTQTKQAVSYAGELGRLAFTYITNKMSVSFQIEEQNWTNFSERKNEIKKIAGWLNDYTLDDKVQRRKILPIIRAIDDLVKEADTLNSEGGGDHSPVPNAMLGGKIKVIKSLSRQVLDVTDGLREFRKTQLKIAESALAHSTMLNKLITTTIAIAFAGNLLIAALLLRFFMSSIYRKLQKLIDNMNRFSRRQALSEPIQGNDEIAGLDLLFHKMYSDLNAAQESKQNYIELLRTRFEQPIAASKEFLTSVKVDTTLAPEATRGAERSERNLERLLKLIDELLLLEQKAHAEKNIDLKVSEVELSDLLKRSMEAVSDFAEKGYVKLELDAPSRLIEADGDRVIQVIVNLLSNAIKFSPKNSTVKIHAHDSSDGIQIQIIDQGRGVPLDKKKKIFERFGQSESSDASEKGGTGLGLPICKDIIEAHGGSLGVDSVEGAGSTFWVKLPKSKVKA